MNRALGSLLLFGLASGLSLGENPDARDTLVPLNSGNANFRRVLASRLIVAPPNYAGVAFLPAFGGESFISVYKYGMTPQGSHVVYTQARSNLYQATDGGKLPEKARTIAVARVDAEISEETARKLREIWKRMLTKARPHARQMQGWQTVPVDATRVEFALQLPGHSPLSAEIDIFNAKPGEKVSGLVALSHTLMDYCKATPAERAAIERDIERKAEALLARLKEAPKVTR